MALDLLQEKEAEEFSPEKQKPPTNHAGDSSSWSGKGTLFKEPNEASSSGSSLLEAPWWMGGKIILPAVSTPTIKNEMPTVEEVEKNMCPKIAPFNGNIQTQAIKPQEADLVGNQALIEPCYPLHQGAIPKASRKRFLPAPQPMNHQGHAPGQMLDRSMPGRDVKPLLVHSTHQQEQLLGCRTLSYGRGGPRPPADEYVGLMTSQEKQHLWAQLRRNQLFLNDYCYKNQQRQLANSGQNNWNIGGQSIRGVLPMRSKPSYAPLQLEDSLGQFQVGSVTAPRKIFDMEKVNPIPETVKINERNFKQTLLEIEGVFKLLVSLEDFAKFPANQVNSDFTKSQIIDLLYSTYEDDIKFLSHMSIRKGRSCITRLIVLMDKPDGLMLKILYNLIAIVRKDDSNLQEIMMIALPKIHSYILLLPLDLIARLCANYDYLIMLTNKFAASIMAVMLARAESLLWSCNDRTLVDSWQDVLLGLANAANENIQIQRPVCGVPREALRHHFLAIGRCNVNPSAIDRLIEALSSLRQ